MELDLIFSSGTLGDVVPFGAIAIALLFTVRNHSGTSTGTSTSNLVYTDPIFFLQVCAGIIRQIAQPTSKVDSKENLTTPLLPEEPTHSIRIISERDAEHEALLSELMEGLKNYPPELCAEGTNGTYFLRDASGDVKAVFKPTDEEGDSPNNPKEHARDVDRGIRQGEAAIREVIAYRLDQRMDNIFRVPPTLLVNIAHPNFVDEEGKPKTKTGSLQYFVQSQGCASDIGPRSFPTEEVHRVAALDMMIYNTDRHDGNILYNREEGLTLTPIDHGFSLPEKFGAAWFDWMYYPQASTTFAPHLASKISSFDVHQFARDISQEFDVREECLMTMILSTMILQRGVEMGKTPKELAQFLSRGRPHEMSPVEVMMSEVEDMDGDFMCNVREKLAHKLSGL